VTGHDFGRAFVRVRRPGPLVVLWRWRYEAGLLAAAILVPRLAGPVWAAAAGLTLLAAASMPFGRRRVWCVVTAHRVRTGCKQAWVHTRDGRIPVVVRTRPVPAGEEVLLWCPAGTAAGDLTTAGLAAACWAREVRVEADRRHRQLVRLTVVRHDAAA
jgi:hypothetical protein